MAYRTSSYGNQLLAPTVPRTGLYVGLGLSVWFGIVSLLGTAEVFVAPPETLPVAVVIAVTAPVIAFVGGFWASPRFHEFVLGLDLRFLTAFQAWRMGGRSFLALYTYGIYPAISLGRLALAIWQLE